MGNAGKGTPVCVGNGTNLILAAGILSRGTFRDEVAGSGVERKDADDVSR